MTRAARLAGVLLALLLCAGPVPGLAQQSGQPPSTIDKLLDALKHAPNPQIAAQIELELRHRWFNAGTPAVTLLMTRGMRELKAGEDKQAIIDFGDAIVLQPNLAEAYHQRAIARYHAGDVTGAILDLEAALRAEPRDFAALETLSNIAAAQQNWKGAYDAWKKMLQIDPMTPDGQDRLEQLKRKAFGEEA